MSLYPEDQSSGERDIRRADYRLLNRRDTIAVFTTSWAIQRTLIASELILSDWTSDSAYRTICDTHRGGVCSKMVPRRMTRKSRNSPFCLYLTVHQISFCFSVHPIAIICEYFTDFADHSHLGYAQ